MRVSIYQHHITSLRRNEKGYAVCTCPAHYLCVEVNGKPIKENTPYKVLGAKTYKGIRENLPNYISTYHFQRRGWYRYTYVRFIDELFPDGKLPGQFTIEKLYLQEEEVKCKMIIYHIENLIHFLDRKNKRALSFDIKGKGCGWFITDEEETFDILPTPDLKDIDLTGWEFDHNFYEEIDCIDDDNFNDLLGEHGIMGTFRVTKLVNRLGTRRRTRIEKFIHIYNRHDNGAYRHFDFTLKDELIEEGDL
jgi:hypothetical protein